MIIIILTYCDKFRYSGGVSDGRMAAVAVKL